MTAVISLQYYNQPRIYTHTHTYLQIEHDHYEQREAGELAGAGNSVHTEPVLEQHRQRPDAPIADKQVSNQLCVVQTVHIIGEAEVTLFAAEIARRLD